MRALWNEGWQFVELPLGSAWEDMKRAEKTPVTLPHDWLIAHADDLYKSGDGWYVKTLNRKDADADCVLLDFDGVYMDCDVLVNGRVICAHRYGYTPFFADLSGLLLEGNNEIAVHVRYQSPNSRWYSGAGIFRSVRLHTLPARHMAPDGFQVNTEKRDGEWLLAVEAEIAGPAGEMPEIALRDKEGRMVYSGVMGPAAEGAAIEITVPGARPWGIERPYLYTLSLSLGKQREEMQVGFRETKFTPDAGFFLNGEPVKLKGVCLHHDLGALGAAFHPDAARRQLEIMRAMGVNAVRTSHNPPARELLSLCDEMGMLVMDELFDMWELPKTEFDNARFFPETYPLDVAAWVRRDRRHPCVILWSVGNEIYDMQASERGQYWTKTLMEEVRRHDDRHAPVTFASNYMPWEGAQKCADIVKLPGYNYAEKLYAAHHKQHPDWVIYGSETGSLLASRGIYHFPMGEDILSDEDLQCSALLNSNTSWGAKDIRALLADDLNTPYSLGQFIWAGIDYIGEPTPYHTRNCYFGQTDTAGFPKDAYYFYQAMWTDAPMIHIGVYWNWNQGQLIDVPVMTNGASAELFLNGKSLGRKEVNRFDREKCLPVWRVPYETGELKAIAYDAEGNALCETVRASFGDAKSLHIKGERDIKAGTIAFLTVSALDEQGKSVENAADRVRIAVEGPAVLLGLDNGDSTDRDGYQAFSRRLFSGKLLAMVGIQEPGKICVRAEAKGLQGADWRVEARGVSQSPPFPSLCKEVEGEDDIWTRQIELTPLSSTRLTPENPSVPFRVRLLPENAAPQEIALRVVNAQGVDVPCARLEREGDRVTLTALGDGDVYLRASVSNGYPHPRVLSQLEVTAQGFGPVGLNPYGFIAGALCDLKEGEIGAGNEQGIAFARDGESAAGFSSVDFGPVGSDEITLPIFALDGDRYEIGLWDGMPGRGGRRIAVLPYQKKSIWNTYQPETYRLPQVLRGVHTIAFSLDRKIHLKGFSFARQLRPLRWNRALDADQIYGDSFEKSEEAVKNIGNNVTLSFTHMEFPKAGDMLLLLDGATELPVNTVLLRMEKEGEEARTCSCSFTKSKRGRQAFSVSVPEGETTVSFVFLPGSRFDFYGFRFVSTDHKQM